MNEWFAGSAISTFPIESGTPLAGYADREGRSTGTLDPLEIGVLTLRSAKRNLHIVTADVLSVDSRLAEEVAQKAKVTKADILFCASHTHSGPQGIVTRLHPASPDTFDPELRKRFVAAVAATVGQALSEMEPVTLGHSQAVIEGAWTDRNAPESPTDQRVRSLQVRRLDGSLQALLMLIPCHPTVLGSGNLDVSADLFGGVRRGVAAGLTGKDAGARLLTINGASADISTRFVRHESSAAEVERLGGLVATQVPGSLASTVEIEPRIKARSEFQRLPGRTVSNTTAQRDLSLARQWLTRLTDNSRTSEAERRQAFTRVQGAELRVEMKNLKQTTLRIQAWGLGSGLALLTVPGELFSSLGQVIEAASPVAETWIVGCANGYVGYIPDRAAFEASTYEALACPFAPEVGRVVTEMGSGLVNRVIDEDHGNQ